MCSQEREVSANPFSVFGSQAHSSVVKPMKDTDLLSSTGKLVRDTDFFSGVGKPVRGVESFSNVERSLSNGERNRELESVQLSQMEKEKILSERRSFHESLEKEADRAFQRDFVAQTRLSEAQAERDRNGWERRNADIALYETSRQLESQRMELYQAN